MTQSEEVPAEPVPDQPAQGTEPTEPTQVIEAGEPTQVAEVTDSTQVTEITEITEATQVLESPAAAPAQPAQPVQAAVPAQPVQPAAFAQPAQAPQPAGEPAPAWGQSAAPAAAGYPVGPAAVPVLSPEEQAAAAAKKAKRRTVFAKSAILAVPGVVLVALLVVTGMQASTLSSKTTDASNAAKSANAAGGLAGQLHAAQSAANGSILVDAGCVAAESQATADIEDKVDSDSNALVKAEAGTSFTTFSADADKYINDLQKLSTDLQQDAGLSTRSSVKNAINTVTGDLRVVITTMQDTLGGDLSTSTEDKFNSAADRLDGDATAVDTMCGGTTLEEGDSSSGDGGGSNGTTNA